MPMMSHAAPISAQLIARLFSGLSDSTMMTADGGAS